MNSGLCPKCVKCYGSLQTAVYQFNIERTFDALVYYVNITFLSPNTYYSNWNAFILK